MKEQINKQQEKQDAKKNKKIIYIYVTLIILVFSLIAGLYLLMEHTNSGSVTGTFISGDTKNGTSDARGYGGPSTTIRLSNYSISGPESSNNEDNFFFNNYYPNVSNMVAGHRYVIEYLSSGGPDAKFTIKNIKEI